MKLRPKLIKMSEPGGKKGTHASWCCHSTSWRASSRIGKTVLKIPQGLPWNRQRRRQLESANAIALHLFSGDKSSSRKRLELQAWPLGSNMSTRIKERRDRAQDALLGGIRRGQRQEKQKERRREREGGLTGDCQGARLRPATPSLGTLWWSCCRREPGWDVGCQNARDSRCHPWLGWRTENGPGFLGVTGQRLHLLPCNRCGTLHQKLQLLLFTDGCNLEALEPRQ